MQELQLNQYREKCRHLPDLGRHRLHRPCNPPSSPRRHHYGERETSLRLIRSPHFASIQSPHGREAARRRSGRGRGGGEVAEAERRGGEAGRGCGGGEAAKGRRRRQRGDEGEAAEGRRRRGGDGGREAAKGMRRRGGGEGEAAEAERRLRQRGGEASGGREAGIWKT
ncbi:hypothetical protein GUJ93_ZPchr0010g11132 [Zizania palustris]|uniref:Uncharacterized protein n=1 Tax=Zizania palustris TaxID=103762 RepID=A0A8J5WHL8_ZIZPA|nr:hypothetical protein GUJ93_ZPchr0010g11132 [Zizania palustris]